MRDLSLREICCLAPLLVFIFWIGLQPRFFLDRMAPTLDELTAPAMQAADARTEAEIAERQCELASGRPHHRIIRHHSPLIPHPCSMTTATLRLLTPEIVLIAAAVAIYHRRRVFDVAAGVALDRRRRRGCWRPSPCGRNTARPRPADRSTSTRWPGTAAGWPWASARCWCC